MARQQALADQIAEKLPKGQEKFVDDEEFVYFYHIDHFYRVPRPAYERISQAFKKQTDAEHDEVVAVGGLHIIGTERHEARRIDNQLRGRAGRQGDPGSSRFYLSLEDDLMRIFGSDRISGLMQRLGMEEGVPIEHRMVTRAIERAQKQVEAQNFSVRKHLLEYDDVMNKERDFNALRTAVTEIYGTDPAELNSIELEGRSVEEMTDALWAPIIQKYERKEGLIPTEILRRVERDIMLQIVDAQWKDHLYSLDHLKEGIGLRGYGQRDPLVEYKKESFALFQAMKDRIEEEIVRYLWRLTPIVGDEAGLAPVRQPASRRPPQLTMHAPSAAAVSPFGAIRGGGAASAVAERPRPTRTGGDDVVRQIRREEPKVGRNDPCPCGSGKKYKKCHGA
jgi:preprotein translocase subunit SecA